MHTPHTCFHLFFRVLTAVTALFFLWIPSAFTQITFLERGRLRLDDPGLGIFAKSPTRTFIDLNGRWSWQETGGSEQGTVRIPSSFLGNHSITFRREFELDGALLQRSVFQFAAIGISYYCEISINGQFVGKHAGMTSFSLKLPPSMLRRGRNTISIVVNNHLNATETTPLRETIWNPRNYGGIIHDIALIASGPVWVQESYIRQASSGEGKAGTLSCKAFLNSGQFAAENTDSALGIRSIGKYAVEHFVEVLDIQTGEIVAQSSRKNILLEQDRLVQVDEEVQVPSVRLWSPELPYLYLVRFRTQRDGILLDESYQYTAFRSFAIKDAGFTLNGNPIFLKGLTYVDESPRHGYSMSLEEMERDVLIMKNLGINTIRLLKGTVHPYFLVLCDRYGLMILLDLPLYGIPHSLLGGTQLQSSVRNFYREILARDNNHPSIIGWGLAQGMDAFSSASLGYARGLARFIRSYSNATVYASQFNVRAGEASDPVDFIAADIFPAGKETASRHIEYLSSLSTGKPLLISSIGYPVQIGNYNGSSDPLSIDAQGQFFLEMYSKAREKNFAGMIAHSFADWNVTIPLMSADRVHQFTNTSGIMDAWRMKRIAYDVLKAKFNNEKPPVVVTGKFNAEHPAAFVVLGITLILLFAVVYNLFRRFRENVVRSLLRPYNFFADVRDQRMLSIFQTSIVGFLGALSGSLFLSNIFYYWRTNPFADVIISLFLTPVWLKQWINFAAWNPIADVVVMTAVLFLIQLAYAIVLRVLAFLLKRNIHFFESFSVSMWAALPMAVLAPFGMILYRIMEVPLLEMLSVTVFVVFNSWVISRLFKGTAIVLDIRPLFFYLAGFGVLIIGGAAWMLSMDDQHATFAYLSYFVDIWQFIRSLPS